MFRLTRLAAFVASMSYVAGTVPAATMDAPGAAGATTSPPAAMGTPGAPAAPPAAPATVTPTVGATVIGGAIIIGIGAALAGGNGESPAPFPTGTGTTGTL